MSSGPPYPRYARGNAPGGNGIGFFQIGLSPIGDIPTWDPWLQIIAEYANSPRIDAIATSFNDAIDQTENLASLYDNIWNVLTAVGYGLDVWGRIVGVSRTLKFPNGVNYFGLEEANSWTGFGQGGFYSGTGTSNNFILSDADFRTLILAKAAGNISDGSIQSINQILLTLFPNRGAAYVANNQNMSVTLTFKFALTPVELAIIEQANVLPIRAGVAVTISQL